MGTYFVYTAKSSRTFLSQGFNFLQIQGDMEPGQLIFFPGYHASEESSWPHRSGVEGHDPRSPVVIQECFGANGKFEAALRT